VENCRRRKRTLFKKAHEFAEISGADVAFFIYKDGRWFTYKSTNRQSFPPSWEQIVSAMIKYILDADRTTANVISTSDKSATTGFPKSLTRLPTFLSLGTARAEILPCVD
jgi:SRF-type transcription factor (DNA-binding and dimerisation domain)